MRSWGGFWRRVRARWAAKEAATEGREAGGRRARATTYTGRNSPWIVPEHAQNGKIVEDPGGSILSLRSQS
jgi:hypothetical protein